MHALYEQRTNYENLKKKKLISNKKKKKNQTKKKEIINRALQHG